MVPSPTRSSSSPKQRSSGGPSSDGAATPSAPSGSTGRVRKAARPPAWRSKSASRKGCRHHFPGGHHPPRSGAAGLQNGHVQDGAEGGFPICPIAMSSATKGRVSTTCLSPRLPRLPPPLRRCGPAGEVQYGDDMEKLRERFTWTSCLPRDARQLGRPDRLTPGQSGKTRRTRRAARHQRPPRHPVVTPTPPQRTHTPR